MNNRIDTGKECGRCHRTLSASHFSLRKYSSGRVTRRSTCKRCALARRDPRPRALGTPIANGKHCHLCSGLPWRIIGPKCAKCGELYEDEPAVELVFRRDYEWTVCA